MIQTPSNPKEYKQQLRDALGNQFLRKALTNFAASYPGSRAAAFAGLDFSALAARLAGAKDENISRLAELYQEFKEKAEIAGAKVHWAASAAEANAIITHIAHDAGCQRIVKSKSMTAEETHLNAHLEAAGLEAVETDLGEWIIQLRDEGPSHMVMPAIHLSRSQVAELFSQVTGRAQDPEDIDGMVKVARRRLRQAFLSADMGISGANFAMASTGTIGLVTNEGNARLTTTLPRVHVALVGLEKLVPDLAGALDILKVLPKNATGQLISSYVTWITGANECAIGPNGRKEMHIVFIDNGRLALSRDPVFSQALRCIRCGACANVCPIYGLVGGHNYGHVYIGAIGLILTYFYHGRDNARALVQNCLNCQACKAVCPASIDLPRLIKKTHGLILDEEKTPPLKNRLLRRVLRNRKLFHFMLRRAYLAQKPFTRGKPMLRHLPFFFSPEHDFRHLPAIVKRPLRDRWPKLVKPMTKPRLKIALFGGCLIDFVYPEQGEALLELLRDRNIQVDYPSEQTCCGLPASMAADEETAAEVARQNIMALGASQYDHVVTLCASCASHIKESYPRLMAGRSGWEVKARQLANKIVDFSSFASGILEQESDASPIGIKTAYHAPCHLCRGLGVHQAPKDLMRKAGLDYVPSANEETCCGFGGSYSFEYPELSSQILDGKLSEVDDNGATLLVTDCPGCVLQLRGGLAKQGSKTRVMHIAEAVTKSYRGTLPK